MLMMLRSAFPRIVSVSLSTHYILCMRVYLVTGCLLVSWGVPTGVYKARQYQPSSGSRYDGNEDDEDALATEDYFVQVHSASSVGCGTHLVWELHIRNKK